MLFLKFSPHLSLGLSPRPYVADSEARHIYSHREKLTTLRC